MRSFGRLVLLSWILTTPVAGFLSLHRSAVPKTAIQAKQPSSFLDNFKFRSDDRLQQALGIGPRPPSMPPPSEIVLSDTAKPFFLGNGDHGRPQTAPSYADMTVAELKAELKGRGLAVGGVKAALIERLQEDDSAGSPWHVEEASSSSQTLVSPPSPMMDEETRALVDGMRHQLVDPLLSMEVERGVAGSVIAGAALSLAGLAALTTKSLVVAPAAGLLGAYVAISPGGLGSAVRTLGLVVWTTIKETLGLAQAIDEDGRLKQTAARAAEASFVKLMEVARKNQERFVSEGQQWRTKAAAAAKTAASTPAAEAVLDVGVPATEAIAEQTIQEAEKEETAVEEVSTEQEAVTESAPVAEPPAEAKQESAKGTFAEWGDAIRAAQKSIDGIIAGWDDMERDVAELEAMDTPKAEPIDGEDQEDKAEIDMEAMAEAARAAVEVFEKEKEAETEQKMAERDQWAADMDTEEDMEDLAAAARAAVEMYQSEDDEEEDDLMDDEDKDDIAAAARAAVEMYQADYTDEEVTPEEEDLATRARAAVETFEATIDEVEDEIFGEEGDAMQDWTKLTVAELRDELMSRGLPATGKKAELISALEEIDASGDEMDLLLGEEEDEEEDIELAELARAAREAVDLFEEKSVLGLPSPSMRDWSVLTVKELRDELKMRGLPTTGKKADLVAALEGVELEPQAEAVVEEDDDTDFDLDDVDMEELGKAARQAAELYNGADDEEPSDEALWEIENSSSMDYQSMTVAELKDELRSRGLPVSGRKSDLIERLEASE